MIKQEWSTLLSEGIYFSQNSLCFYKGFYSELGTDDIRELPTTISSYLQVAVDVKEKAVNGACFGRYRDENEADESEFKFGNNGIRVNSQLISRYSAIACILFLSIPAFIRKTLWTTSKGVSTNVIGTGPNHPGTGRLAALQRLFCLHSQTTFS